MTKIVEPNRKILENDIIYEISEKQKLQLLVFSAKTNEEAIIAMENLMNFNKK